MGRLAESADLGHSDSRVPTAHRQAIGPDFTVHVVLFSFCLCLTQKYVITKEN